MKIIREPLFHFFVIGALLFGWTVLRTPDAPPVSEIRVATGQIENISRLFERTWQRPPSEDELETLIENHVREEIFVKEAKAMGLDQNDAVIRNRLVQKYAFLMDDLASARAPTDEELSNFLTAEADRYIRPPKVSFQQVFASSRRGAEDAKAHIARIKVVLEAGGRPDEFGDPIDLPTSITQGDRSLIVSIFGPAFFEAIVKAPQKVWTGPVRSAYGFHLIRVDAREKTRMPDLSEVQDQVAEDWREAQRQTFRADLLDRLKANYRVIVEPITGLSKGTAS